MMENEGAKVKAGARLTIGWIAAAPVLAPGWAKV
jgi:hypothetical protein